MSYGYIYKTTNLINGRFYIGQRKGQFQPSYLGSGIYIRRAIRQHRPVSFSVECLVWGDSRFDLDWLERHLISEYRETVGRGHLYNISDGGTGGRNKGFIPWNKGKTGTFHHTAEAKKRISNFNKGKHLSDEQKRRMSLAQKGKPKSEVHKQALKENHANFSGDKHPRWMPDKKRFSLCVDCGDTVGPKAKRCITCRNREQNRVRYSK